ncbi:tyrosine-type recombinase/integrase [Salinibacillus aidingensis]|uniref:Tyrosine-type recombinase/integrase n=1 Tax=Salinibacillus aidingensis TaxID=237684 RepID=A0ABN1BS12_9BACI
MKVQKIDIGNNQYRYLLLDNEFNVIEPIKRYLKFLDNTDKAENTLKNYAYHLKAYFEYLYEIGLSYNEISSEGNNPIEILGNFASWLENPTIINDKLSYLSPPEAKRSNQTINLIIIAVLGFYEFLSKGNELPELDVYKEQRMNPQFKSFLHELIPNSNMIRKNILHRKTEQKEVEAITREQYNQLLEHCNTIRDKALLAVLFEGGLRLSEALGLFIEDIEPFNNKIKIQPRENLENGATVKNKAKGELYVPPYVMKYITDYIVEELVDVDTNFLFVNLRGKNKGHPMKSITIQKLFNRLSKKVGFNVHPHMCRHGHGTELIESGWDVVEIKDRLRHTNVQSTTVYTHLSDKHKKKKIQELYEKKGIANDSNNNE